MANIEKMRNLPGKSPIVFGGRAKNIGFFSSCECLEDYEKWESFAQRISFSNLFETISDRSKIPPLYLRNWSFGITAREF